MGRIKLIIPEKKIASINIPVRITDINYGNHVGNDALVSIIHEARMQWLQLHGFTELNIAGTGLIMSELVVEFKNESFYGDMLKILLSVGETTRVGFELFYQLYTTRNSEIILIGNAKTSMLCYDYEIKKVIAVPAVLKELFII
jgi:acyl-CoA thioester hydrolase